MITAFCCKQRDSYNHLIARY